MNDDRMSVASSREVFEAIVSQLDDPEGVLVRRRILLLGAIVFVVASAVTIFGAPGWQILLAFSSTFVPSLIVLATIAGRSVSRSRGSRHGRVGRRRRP